MTSGEGNSVDENENIDEKEKENEDEEEEKECGWWDWECQNAQNDGVQNDPAMIMESDGLVAVNHGKRSWDGNVGNRRSKRSVDEECEGIPGAVQASKGYIF